MLVRWEKICEWYAEMREHDRNTYAEQLADLRCWYYEHCRDHRERASLRGLRRWLREAHPLHLKDARAIWYLPQSELARTL